MRIIILLIASALLAHAADGPFPPHRVTENVYYVGSRDLASYLITTPQGNILINTGLESTVPLIRASVKKLGLRFEDIKIILISHAHFDHCESVGTVKRLTGAQLMVMAGDAEVVESGGRNAVGSDHRWAPVKVDRVLHDHDTVTLGGVTLTAHLTPGHTRGCTTWTLRTRENGKDLDVVIVGSPYVNPGYRLAARPTYPGIAQDYERGFAVLKSLPCDIFLGAHGSYYGMEAKYQRLGKSGNPFIDPQGYKRFVAETEAEFYERLKADGAKH